MKTATKRQTITRWGIYLCGIVVLVMGLTLNAKSGLGLSPMISVAYAAASAMGLSFSICTFFLYIFFLVVQLIVMVKNSMPIGIKEALQLPFTMAFSLLLDVFEKTVPVHFDALWQNVLLAVFAVSMVGAGMSMIMNMQLVLNPADGVVQKMSMAFGIEPGLMKNIADAVCVSISLVLDIVFNSLWTSIGLGTVISMILAGRMMHLFNRLFLKKMLRAAGLE